MKQCAPYLADAEEERLYSEYSGIKSKADYAKILEVLRKIANDKELRLHSEELW